MPGGRSCWASTAETVCFWLAPRSRTVWLRYDSAHSFLPPSLPHSSFPAFICLVRESWNLKRVTVSIQNWNESTWLVETVSEKFTDFHFFVCKITVCPFVALLKAYYAETLYIVLSCPNQKMFIHCPLVCFNCLNPERTPECTQSLWVHSTYFVIWP